MNLGRTICLFFVLFTSFFYGCSESTSCNLIKPSSIEEVSQSVFTIIYKGIPHGQGLLVGLDEDKNDRVFFLTARHVVTFESISSSELRLDFGRNGNASIITKADRWYTAPRDFDVAWFELTQEEKKMLTDRGLLDYIPLYRSNKKGSWAIELHKYAKENPNSIVRTTMFYQKDAIDGRMYLKNSGKAPLPFPHNQHLKSSYNLVFLVDTKNICKPGDSGGAVFIQCKIRDEEFWLLGGILVGGNTNRHVNAILPIDIVIKTILFDSRRLVDFPEYW